MPGPLTITLNGQSRTFQELSPGVSLQGLVDFLQLKGDRIAVELDGQIAPRSSWSGEAVNEGGRVEIVHFVGGGCGAVRMR